jgi:hypothetical protein
VFIAEEISQWIQVNPSPFRELSLILREKCQTNIQLPHITGFMMYPVKRFLEILENIFRKKGFKLNQSRPSPTVSNPEIVHMIGIYTLDTTRQVCLHGLKLG